MLNFVIRNPWWAVNNVRSLGRVRKAMALYKKAFPICEYTQHPKWKVHVHHWLPVKDYPQYADCLWNFYSLAAKGSIHLAVGHNGNWKTIAKDLPDIIFMRRSQDWYSARVKFLQDNNCPLPEDFAGHIIWESSNA